MKKVSTFTGALFLVWLLGSPILGLVIYGWINLLNPLVFIVLTYIVLGLLAYILAKRVSGKNKALITTIDKSKKNKPWTAVFSYVVGTNMLFFALFNLTAFMFLRFFGNSSLLVLYFIGTPLVTLLAVNIAFAQTQRMFILTENFAHRSVLLFVGLNAGFSLFLKLSQNNFSFTLADLSAVLGFLVFYSYTNKKLKIMPGSSQ